MRKFQKFFYTLLDTSVSLSVDRNVIKKVIGDSTNNNRTLTVNQVVRFLEQVRGSRKLALRISAVYNTLRSDILVDRKNTTKRTDAIDINELVDTYRAIVMNDGLKRITVGRTISKVG